MDAMRRLDCAHRLNGDEIGTSLRSAECIGVLWRNPYYTTKKGPPPSEWEAEVGVPCTKRVVERKVNFKEWG